jgi:hypothetical protein
VGIGGQWQSAAKCCWLSLAAKCLPNNDNLIPAAFFLLLTSFPYRIFPFFARYPQLQTMVARVFVALVAATAALFTVASAQLQVLSPGGSNEWWIQQSENLLTWNCDQSQEQTFTVLVANPNMASPLAIIAQQPNYVCSLLVTKDEMGALVPGTGYTVQLANIFNSTDVYAESSPFEIKAIGSAYPSTTSSEIPSSTSSGSSSTGTPKPSNSASLKSSMGYATTLLVGAITGTFML